MPVGLAVVVLLVVQELLCQLMILFPWLLFVLKFFWTVDGVVEGQLESQDCEGQL